MAKRTRFVLDKEAALGRLFAYRQSYLGLAELAMVLGLSTKALAMRRKRCKFSLKPAAKLSLGPVWEWSQIYVYLNAKKGSPHG